MHVKLKLSSLHLNASDLELFGKGCHVLAAQQLDALKREGENICLFARGNLWGEQIVALSAVY